MKRLIVCIFACLLVFSLAACVDLGEITLRIRVEQSENPPDVTVGEETPELEPPPLTEPTDVPPIVIEPPVVVEPPALVSKVTYIKCLATNLNIRKGASTSSAVLGLLQKDEMLIYLAKEGDFYKTYYKNEVAYVSASKSYTVLVDIEEGNSKVESVLNVGYKLLGFEYVYGAQRLHWGNGIMSTAFDATKYDCSSLMQYMFYYGANYNLQITTRTQIEQGTVVAKSDLKRGDLIFFTNASRANNVGLERVGHVAIYLGDNYILHTASTYAQIVPMTAERWGYYIQANRFFY